MIQANKMLSREEYMNVALKENPDFMNPYITHLVKRYLTRQSYDDEKGILYITEGIIAQKSVIIPDLIKNLIDIDDLSAISTTERIARQNTPTEKFLDMIKELLLKYLDLNKETTL